MTKPVDYHAFVRQSQNRIVLDNEVAEAVEDGFTLVDFDPAIEVRAVADKKIGASVYEQNPTAGAGDAGQAPNENPDVVEGEVKE